LGNHTAFTVLAAGFGYACNAVEHKHRRKRQLRISGSKQFAASASEQILIFVAVAAFRHISSFIIVSRLASGKASPNYHTLNLPQPLSPCGKAQGRDSACELGRGCLYYKAKRGRLQREMREKVPDLPIERLRMSGLRPTRQRVALADLLFGRGD